MSASSTETEAHWTRHRPRKHLSKKKHNTRSQQRFPLRNAREQYPNPINARNRTQSHLKASDPRFVKNPAIWIRCLSLILKLIIVSAVVKMANKTNERRPERNFILSECLVTLLELTKKGIWCWKLYRLKKIYIGVERRESHYKDHRRTNSVIGNEWCWINNLIWYYCWLPKASLFDLFGGRYWCKGILNDYIINCIINMTRLFGEISLITYKLEKC